MSAAAPAPEPPPPDESRFAGMRIGRGFGDADFTSNHVACIVAVAFGVVVLLYMGGFKFAVDAGVTRA